MSEIPLVSVPPLQDVEVAVVPALPTPFVAAVHVGSIGPAGPPGQSTLEAGFGSIDYSDLDKGTPLGLPEGIWTRVARNLAPATSNDGLPTGPWTDFQFWRDGLLWARAQGDGYLIKFSYRVVPQQRGSSLKFGVWPNGESAFDFAPGPIMIAADAGHEEASSATFYTKARSRFANAGAQIYLMSSSGATLLEFSPEIAPVSFKR